MPSLNRIINAFAERHGCIAGVCDASPLPRAPYSASNIPFVSADLNKRTHPAAILKDAQSIIVLGVPWPAREDTAMSNSKAPGCFAELSSLGTVPDYHKRVKALLLDLAEALRAAFPGASPLMCKALTDSPTLDERALAHRAGLGFFGRHGLLISREYGTRFNIGCLLTSLPCGPPGPAAASREACQGCSRCIAACPVGALRSGPERPLDAARCISYLTQKEDLSPEEEKHIGNRLWGCDICQDACPHNALYGKTFVDPHRWLSMTDEDFARDYGHTAMLWRGTALLRRNARVVINNQKEPTP